jgi:thioredoxin 1
MSAFSDLINSPTPVLVVFVAEWGKYCDTVTDTLKHFKSTQGDQVKMIRIDMDKNAEVASKFDVVGVPTTLLFKEGSIKWRHSGNLTEELLSVQFKKLV